MMNNEAIQRFVDHMLQWLVYECIVGAIPLLVSMLFGYLLGYTRPDYYMLSNELLFLSLVLGITTENDVRELAVHFNLHATPSTIGHVIAMLFIVASAILYGLSHYMSMDVANPSHNAGFDEKIACVALIAAGAAIVFGFIFQWYVLRVKGDRA